METAKNGGRFLSRESEKRAGAGQTEFLRKNLSRTAQNLEKFKKRLLTTREEGSIMSKLSPKSGTLILEN